VSSSAAWTPIKLRRIVSLRPSPVEVEELPDGIEVSFFPMEAIGDQGTLDRTSTRLLGQVRDGYSYFREGDVLRAKVTPCFENGKGAVATQLVSGFGFGTTELFVMRPTQVLDARFLFYLVSSDEFTELGAATAYGAHGVKRVDDNFVREFAVALPSLLEQRSIVEYLDAKTAQMARAIAVSQELVGAVTERFGVILDEMTTATPSSSISVRRLVSSATTGSRDWSSRVGVGDSRFFRSANLRRDSIDPDLSDDNVVRLDAPNNAEADRARVLPGDVLVGVTGANAGWVALWSSGGSDTFVSQHVARLHPLDGVNPLWLAYALSSPNVRSQLAAMQYGGTKTGLGLDDLRQIVVRRVSSTVQASDAVAVAEADRRRRATLSGLRRGVALFKERRKALITAAVAGRVDIVREAI
jgi:type I restriction enzyme S subunit